MFIKQRKNVYHVKYYPYGIKQNIRINLKFYGFFRRFAMKLLVISK